MMEKKLHGKVALVTGAGGLIGRDTVQASPPPILSYRMSSTGL